MTNQDNSGFYFKELLKTYLSNSNSVLVSLIIISTYLVWFTLGLLFGGAYTHNNISIELASITSWVSTLTVFILGTIIIYKSFFKHHPIIILSVITMMGANISYTLGLFSIPAVDFMFDIATIFTMIVLYCFSKDHGCLHIR